MHQKGYADGASGNISARLDSDHLLATPSGLAKGFMSPDQLIVVDMEGNRAGESTPANAHLRPTSELLMHLACYQQRPDVQGVVHAHPATAVALTIAGYDFNRVLMPEAVIVLGQIALIPYATPASAENREAIRQSVRDHDALMLALHGSLTVAKTVWDAYLRLENLEHTARILFMVEQLGGAKTALSADEIESLLAIRKRLGYRA